MNDETYEALKSVVRITSLLLYEKYKNKNQLDNNELWEKTTLTKGLSQLETWIDEVAKDYNTYCHLCGAVEESHYCTNTSCIEYLKYEN